MNNKDKDQLATPRRTGQTVEYKIGPYYLTHTEWTDGHEDTEIWRCKPMLLFHSYDDKNLDGMMSLLENLAKREKGRAELDMENKNAFLIAQEPTDEST